MRRSDREITDFQELITVMRGCDVCRLALHDEPYPYILPLNFGLEVDGETVRLYFHGANTGTKYDLIAKNPNVSFEMDRGHELILDDEHARLGAAHGAAFSAPDLPPARVSAQLR